MNMGAEPRDTTVAVICGGVGAARLLAGVVRVVFAAQLEQSMQRARR